MHPNKFYAEHKEHVDRIVANTRVDGYAPTGLDATHPELWKGAHWKWFFSAKEESK